MKEFNAEAKRCAELLGRGIGEGLGREGLQNIRVVDLGVVPAPLSEILTLRQLVEPALVRVPGAWRDGKLQRLVWLED